MDQRIRLISPSIYRLKEVTMNFHLPDLDISLKSYLSSTHHESISLLIFLCGFPNLHLFKNKHLNILTLIVFYVSFLEVDL